MKTFAPIRRKLGVADDYRQPTQRPAQGADVFGNSSAADAYLLGANPDGSVYGGPASLYVCDPAKNRPGTCSSAAQPQAPIALPNPVLQKRVNLQIMPAVSAPSSFPLGMMMLIGIALWVIS